MNPNDFVSGLSDAWWTCSICKKASHGFGNNPQPVKNLEVWDRCCDTCDKSIVIPRRWRESRKEVN